MRATGCAQDTEYHSLTSHSACSRGSLAALALVHIKQSHSQESRQACFMSQAASYSSGPAFAHPDLPGGLFLSWLLEFICGRQKLKSHVQKDEPRENFCKIWASLPETVWEEPHTERKASGLP